MTYSLDSNHNEIVTAFQQIGAKVVDNARVKRHEPGQLDMWVGLPTPSGEGVWIWVEVKTDKGQLRPAQLAEVNECNNKGLPVEVVRSTKDIEDIYNRYVVDGG